jgi:hypothetical protein
MKPVRTILATLLLPAAVAAAPADLKQCAAIAADAARLACYDRLAGRDGSGPGVPASPAAGSPAPVPTAASVTPVAAASPPGQSFGLYAAEHPAPPPAPDTIEARVTEVGTSANGRTTVTLDGGQLWELFDADPLLAAGDTVTITRARLGSFMLQTPTKRSHRARRLR